MRTIYRRVDTRDPVAAEQLLSLIGRDKPDVVIVEGPHVHTPSDVMAHRDFWSKLGDWNVIFANVAGDAGALFVSIASPWRLSEVDDLRRKATFEIGRVVVGGPRPGTVRATWPPESSGIDVDIGS